MGLFNRPGMPIHVGRPEDMPKQEHYAIFKFDTRSTSTYEMNDGSVTVIDYEAYTDRAAWMAEIEHLEERKRNGSSISYQPVIIKPKQVKVNVSVDIEEINPRDGLGEAWR